MKTLWDRLHRRLYEVPRLTRRLSFAAIDALLAPIALWCAYGLRLADFWEWWILTPGLPVFAVAPFVAVALFWWSGVYRILVRSSDRTAAFIIARGVVALVIGLYVLAYLAPHLMVPRSVPVIFGILYFLMTWGSRLAGQSYFFWLTRRLHDLEPVIVYGAGRAGLQLHMALDAGREYEVVAFVDDDHTLQGTHISGRRVYPPDELKALIDRHGVKRLLLAMPSIPLRRRQALVKRLSDLDVMVQTVPSTPELLTGMARIDALRPVTPEDLLERASVDPHIDLLSPSIRDKAVMVTGAGGSIGSQLCRQIVALGPRLIVLYEISEFALYSIDEELRDIALAVAERDDMAVPAIYPVLGNVCDAKRVGEVIEAFGIETVYHAAAYKHVPLVEQNVLGGLANNVLGTDAVVQEALRHGVERFTLVSTDKAVRPTNVMGATKRWAELVCQDAQTRSTSTVFSMVRFGNVLGSSGSVVPLFERQIKRGGPVTVTHPDVTRFFMTIPEAAQLVVQAGAMASGGEVFLLDMGEPVRIDDLARRMIELHGLKVRDAATPDGDVDIVYTGLRPGEKLYEELLIGDNPMPTQHPKIMRSRENGVDAAELADLLAGLRAAVENTDVAAAIGLLCRAVPEYRPIAATVDIVATHRPATDGKAGETASGAGVGGTGVGGTGVLEINVVPVSFAPAQRR